MTLGCDRAILESRWPWFAKQLRNYRLRLRTAAKGMMRQRSNDILASLPEETENGSSSAADGRLKPLSLGSSSPRITPRQLIATEPSPVMLAILTYLYTGCICTRLQRHPAIIAALLVASRMYDMDDLARWAQYAAHVALSTTLAPLMPGFGKPASSDGSSSVASQDPPLPPLERHRLAVAIYEAATLSGFEALQIRALRSVMAIAKWVQRISTSSRSSSIAGLTDGTSSDKDRILERRRQASLGLYPTQTRSTASPQGSRRSSMSTSDGQPSSGFPRRDSRSERLAQLRDAEESNGARDGLSAANNFYTPSSSMPSSLSSTRRPSAVSLQGSARGNGGVASVNGMTLPLSPIKAHSSATGPPSAMPPPSASGRKRFSIFGRSSEASKLMSTGNALDHTDDDASSSTGPSAWGGKNRMQRVNTDGGHTDGMLSTSRSNSSLTSAQGSSTPTAATNEATGVNGLEGYHFGGPNGSAIGIAPRDSSRMREGSFSSATGSTANAARRVTAATLGRLKSATLSGSQSASASPSYALDGASSAEALQPSRPAPTHVPQSARSSVATSATLTGASSHTATPPASSAGHRPRGNNNANGNKKASLPTGSLSDKDIKALQSIWA